MNVLRLKPLPLKKRNASAVALGVGNHNVDEERCSGRSTTLLLLLHPQLLQTTHTPGRGNLFFILF